MGLRGAAVLCANALLLLGACSGSDAGAQTPAPIATPTAITSSAPTTPPTAPSATGATPTATGAPSATSRASLVPAAARAHTSAGASAFAVHYLRQVNEAWKSADASALRKLSASGCVACENFTSTADTLRSKGQHYAADAVGIYEPTTLPESTDDRAVILVPARQLVAKVLSKSGTTVRSTAAVGLLTEATVIWTAEGAWAFAKWTVQERTPIT